MVPVSRPRVSIAIVFYMSVVGICGVQQTHSDGILSSHMASANNSENVRGTMKNDQGCPKNAECSQLSGSCLNCTFNESCVYGQEYNVTCTPKYSGCLGEDKQLERTVVRTMICRYCYQTEHWEHTCQQKANCNSVASPKAFYRSNCSVKDDVICMGRRRFYKNLPCNWTGGYRWSTAFALSITLGGFGADRFYLGHWQEGLGKLFSFGGLGVWTLIDVVLITLHYLGPADGSLFL